LNAIPEASFSPLVPWQYRICLSLWYLPCWRSSSIRTLISWSAQSPSYLCVCVCVCLCVCVGYSWVLFCSKSISGHIHTHTHTQYTWVLFSLKSLSLMPHLLLSEVFFNGIFNMPLFFLHCPQLDLPSLLKSLATCYYSPIF
jgi:hypothetical protein